MKTYMFRVVVCGLALLVGVMTTAPTLGKTKKKKGAKNQVVKPLESYVDLELRLLAEAYEEGMGQAQNITVRNNETGNRRFRPSYIAFEKAREGTYLALYGPSDLQYYGWKTNRLQRVRATFQDIVAMVTPLLVEYCGGVKDFTGYRFVIYVDVIPNEAEAARSLLRRGGNRTTEKYDFFVPFDSAAAFAGAKITRFEYMFNHTLAIYNDQEKMW